MNKVIHKNIASKHSFLITLVTQPQNEEIEFNEAMVTGHYGNFRSKTTDNHRSKGKRKSIEIDQCEYNPIKYYLFGNFDVVYLSLVNNYKFNQRVFEPIIGSNGEESKSFKPFTFQSYSGIPGQDETEYLQILKNIISNKNQESIYNFIGIINIKLNNGVSITGNAGFIDVAIKVILDLLEKGKFKQNKYIIIKSFSWFELSLITFAENLSDIVEVITAIRKIKCNHILLKPLLTKSCYTELFGQKYDLKNINLVSDTSSHFGVHPIFMDEKYIIKNSVKAKSPVIFEIEWQVKPGHTDQLNYELEELGYQLSPLKYFISGKTDYIYKHNENSFANHITLLRIIINGKYNIYKHIRKIKTRLLFERKNKKINKPWEIIDLQAKLNDVFVIPNTSIAQINNKLKILKISREIRLKILKVFTNYYHGIQDPIMFPLFLDFTIFIKYLEKVIQNRYQSFLDFYIGNNDKASNIIEKYATDISSFERLLMKQVFAFQESYSIRFLNAYQFEDINEFDLDINHSIQKVLTNYNSLVIELGNLFYENEYTFGPLVLVNLRNTISDLISINYYVSHLFCPEFVIYTIFKEIINSDQFENLEYKKILMNYEKVAPELENISSSLFNEHNTGRIKLDYYVSDLIRFGTIFCYDFDLYYYTTWSFNMQNTMLYDHNGEFDHNRFRIEMFKTLLLAKIVKNDLSNIEAPCLQLESLWKIYKSQLIRNVENYFYFLNNEGILRDVTNHIGKKLAIFYDAVITQSSLNTSEMNIEISMPIYGYFKNITTGAQFRTKNNVYRYVNYLNNNDKTANESFSNLNAIKTMYMHLKTICNLNSNKILVLNRHHLSGDPIKNVSIENKNQLYLLDPMGGVFYQNEHHCNKHTQMINNFFIWLSEFSQFSKLNLINHFNNNQSPQ